MNLAFLYGGPDQLMPLTSGFAAVFAFLLIFWNKVLVMVGKIMNVFKRQEATATATNAAETSEVKGD
jgi:hypothetical protein